MATKYRKCYYDGEIRGLFSNYDKANDFINHIPEVVSGEHKVFMYKAYYCPKCLGWHVRVDYPQVEGTFKYPDNTESYNKTVDEYKKRFKQTTSDDSSSDKSVNNENQSDDKIFAECQMMLKKFIDWLDDSYNNEYNDKSAKWIRECCNYINRYIIHSKEKDNDEELNNAYAMRDVLYEKSVDMLYLLFSKVDELYEDNEIQNSYKLYFDIRDAIKNIDEKMNIEDNIYDMFGELININEERFREYSKDGTGVIRGSGHMKRAKQYTENAECYSSIKDWCNAYECIQKAREEIESLVKNNIRYYYDECTSLIDRLIAIEIIIEKLFNKE